MRKDIQKLLELPEIQNRVSSILIARDLVRGVSADNSSGFFYTELTVTKKGLEAIKEGVEIPDKFITEMRTAFPIGKRSSSDEVKAKLTSLLFENPAIQLEDIKAAYELYLSRVADLTYCEKAGNFISKQEKGSVRQTIKEYLEEVREEPEEQNPMFQIR